MGAEGMRASLVSREVIADSIELVARGHHLDAIVMLCGCDKTIPGTIMALARLNLPGVVFYGGSIAPGRFEGHDVTIQDVFEAVGAHAAGRMTDARLQGPRGSRVSGRGRLRRPVHREHDGDGLRVPRRDAPGQRQRAGPAEGEGRRGARRRPAGDVAARTRRAAARHHHARSRSKTRSRASRRAAAPRTPCCICSPSHAKRVWNCRWTISIASASGRR